MLSGPSSAFKNILDDVLHYTCAHRAEIIEYRRKARPINEFQEAKLAQIPPSETHLFEEERLDEFVNKQGGLFRIFRTKNVQHRHRENQERYRTKNKRHEWKKTHPSTSAASTSNRNTKKSKESARNSKKRHSFKKGRTATY
ncbi:hypothetical protein ACJJTC_009662 [Scirpophaga incertulas]